MPNQQLSILGVTNNRWGRSRSLSIGDHLWPSCFENSHHGVGRSKVDSDDPPHTRALRGPKLPVSTHQPKVFDVAVSPLNNHALMMGRTLCT